MRLIVSVMLLAAFSSVAADFAPELLYGNRQELSEDDRLVVFEAAEAGIADAQYTLGLLYRYGEGFREDKAQAVFWFRKAAEQGNADAQHLMGLMYHYGEGVPQDAVHAYAWMNLAAAQGHEEAEEALTENRLSMTPGQVAEAQELSRDLAAWIAEGGQGSQPTLGSAPRRKPPELASSGSGFLIGRDGEIVTNYHVVYGCARVTVNRAGTSYDATVRAVDVADDLV